ncbi:uncharacterized protein LOC131977994 [Centropristis striata]|uniref:uncharacterized protein LOC131977994 n=1 Tax=Centropristis striata TaxID=184440 RepID=UPI0027E0D96D|nr:uncharacterized protein LOC131977994 [Centropristis striata]
MQEVFLRMKLSKRKLLVITENIEMKLFSSEETCMVTITHVEEELSFHQSPLEHPLVLDCEEDKEEPELQVQTPPRQQAEPKTASPVRAEVQHCPPVLGAMEDIEIEMEVFPPLPKSEDSSIMSSPSTNRASRLRWKSLSPQRTGLVVKDILCLPGGHELPQLERHTVPRAKERAALAALGMTARITIDCRWSANQMERRLAALFQDQSVERAGQTFSFTYLQCVPGSRVLFVPDTPAEGWTGEQVLRTSGHGALYVLRYQEQPQEELEKSASETPEVNNGTEFCLESCSDEDNQTESCDPDTTEEIDLDLDSILTRFRQENVDQDSEIQLQVKRRDLLQDALKAVRRRGFCCRTTPLVSFSGEDTDGHEGPIREFFRLSLQQLQQQSCVFEGHPGRLLFTYDLAALEDRKYYEAGVLIGWSLAQGGPGPRCLHPALYQLMCGQNPSLEDFSWRDIVDMETQTLLQQLHGAERLSPDLSDWLSSCRIPEVSAQSDETLSVYIKLVKHHIYHRVSSMISQFTEGLNSCGALWDTMRCHWEQFVPVMTSEQQQPLTLQHFKQLFSVCYSRADGGLRTAEETTAGHWDTVLSRVSDGQTDFSFEDLLTFITGADQLTPPGPPGLISLCFYSQDAGSLAVRLPQASTCALQLFLPRGVASAAELTELLSRAVHESLGFTRLQTQKHAEGCCIEVMTG